jgi:hypothetical protein
LKKIMDTMKNGFGCVGCIREKSATRAEKISHRLPSHGRQEQHYCMIRSRA